MGERSTRIKTKKRNAQSKDFNPNPVSFKKFSKRVSSMQVSGSDGMELRWLYMAPRAFVFSSGLIKNQKAQNLWVVGVELCEMRHS